MNAISAVKMDKTAFSVVSLTDEPDDKEYWLTKTPQERLQTVELLRQLNYGYDPTTAIPESTMNLTATMGQIEQLSVDDRIRLLQAIWNSIATEDRELGLTDEQKELLDRRMADLDAAPENVITWETIKERVGSR
ncbi:MAG: addiction module protein [Armatimonadota bacterium]|nr:addiction module protein [Armatimonadota bacterium]